MQTTRTFDKLAAALAEAPRYIDNRGGARSGKTIAELQILSLIAAKDKKPTITSVVSENLPHLKRGAIRDFKLAMADMGLWNEDRWSKQDYIYTFDELLNISTPTSQQNYSLNIWTDLATDGTRSTQVNSEYYHSCQK